MYICFQSDSFSYSGSQIAYLLWGKYKVKGGNSLRVLSSIKNDTDFC